jgi:mRNA interferase MazF
MKQGSIWKIDLDPTIGAEMQKSRPCLILSSDKIGKLPLKVIAPITEYKESYRFVPWMVTIEPSKENGLNKISVIDLFQVRSVSQMRLIGKVGEADRYIVEQCRKAIDIVFEMRGR